MKAAAVGAGLFLAPLAWFASLEANFALAPLACAGQGKSPLMFVSIAAFAMAALGSVFAWSQRAFRSRLAVAGTVISALCALVILAQAIPNLILGGCE